MANYRQIHVSIWKDEWFLDLEPDEKLLFVYLFSNESTSLAGIYKLAFRVICFETGLSAEEVTATLDKFMQADKAYYEDGIVWIPNMRKYHETKSPKVRTRIVEDVLSLPDTQIKIRYLQQNIPYGYPIDTSPQLKEEEKEYKKEDEDEDEKEPSPSSSIFPFEEYEQEQDNRTPGILNIYAKVTSQLDIPSRNKTEVIHDLGIVVDYYAAIGQEVDTDQGKRVYTKWCNTLGKNGRKYSKLNPGWVQWWIDELAPLPRSEITRSDLPAYLFEETPQ